MSIDNRKFHRIVLDLPCKFGREHQLYERQVNLSAGGAAFLVKDEMSHHFEVGDLHFFSFVLHQRQFEFESYVVRRNQQGHQFMTALQFMNIDDHVRKNLDTMILSLGGYQKNDLEKKRQYLSWYAPQLLHPHPNTTNTPSTTPQPDTSVEHNEKAIAPAHTNEGINNLNSLDDLFKEFGA